MPTISVIVPIYNAEKHLHCCINSILAQTFTDFELLLVDDGSTDNSGKICDEYTAKDNRIRGFHKRNGGVSSARNLGLDNVNGDWITFVDSDDWIEEDAFEKTINGADCDLVVGAMFFEHDKTFGSFPLDGKVDGMRLNLLLSTYIDHYSICSPCSKLFKNEIIRNNHLRFKKSLCFGEDSVFVKRYLSNVQNIRIVNTLFYHYQDIGDDIYQKYSRSFKPILDYYNEIVNTYCEIERKRRINISRKGVIGVVFNIAKMCLKNNGKKDLKYILEFLRDEDVKTELYKRNSIHINIQLLLAKLPKGCFLLYYVRLTNIIKSFIVCKS